LLSVDTAVTKVVNSVALDDDTTTSFIGEEAEQWLERRIAKMMEMEMSEQGKGGNPASEVFGRLTFFEMERVSK